jgi:hypothetical protein
MRNRKPTLNLIEQLAAAEDSFRNQQFLAPAIPGAEVQVRIGTAVCRMKIAPDDFRGFGIFESISFTEAILVREATLRERRDYLNLFTRVSLIATQRLGNLWFGSIASRGDQRFQLDGLVCIQMPENVDLFDVIDCRFDGNAFWYDRVSRRVNRRFADSLRQALMQEKPTAEIRMPGMTAEHRTAYDYNYQNLIAPRKRREEKRQRHIKDVNFAEDSDVSRIRDSLWHAGAHLTGLREQHGNYQVRYTVGGRTFSSAVSKDSLGVVSAGVCLDGHDREFDLTSLVGVLREGMTTRQV